MSDQFILTVDVSDLIVDPDVDRYRENLTTEEYFLAKYGSIHNAYLAFKRIQEVHGRPNDMESFLEVFAMTWDK